MLANLLKCEKCSAENRITEQPSLASFRCGICHAELRPKFQYLFFDCESTSLPSSKEPGFLVQFAFSLRTHDGVVIQNYSSIVKPEAFAIPESSTNVHGISDEVARMHGRELKEVLTAFLKVCDPANVRLISHNLAFDRKILESELKRVNKSFRFSSFHSCCTMESTQELLKLPSRGKDYKWPKLQELHSFLFGKGFRYAHKAESDVEACAKCFFELLKRKLIYLE